MLANGGHLELDGLQKRIDDYFLKVSLQSVLCLFRYFAERQTLNTRGGAVMQGRMGGVGGGKVTHFHVKCVFV